MAESTQRLDSGQVSDEQVRFVADARLISVLGEQLIGSEKVGILELVKNAYDAGALSCTVTIEGVPGLRPEARSLAEYKDLSGPIIEIRDDGSGMTHEVLLNGWLRPATPSRARIKEQLRAEREAAEKRGSVASFDALVDELKEAHGGRLPLGEKGIGRLATHRLGQFLWLRTKTADDPLEWELKIPWSKFDSLGQLPVNLDSVQLTLRHQPQTTTYGARGSGTVVCCYGGRPGYQWTEDQIIEIGRAVNGLRSPRKAPTRFEPQFITPHVPQSTLASPLERSHSPFELVAIVDGDGKADIEFQFTPPVFLAETLQAFNRAEALDLRAKNKDSWKSNGNVLRRPACGPFVLHIRAWLRTREWLGPDFKEVSEYLDHFGGITIYRDGLATLPAQQTAKEDWLGLALSHIKKASNISYYNLAGEVEVQQERTLALRDRSSREGMIETQAFKDLAILTRSVVDQLQFEIQSIREKWQKARISHASPKTLRAQAKIMSQTASLLAERYDFRKDPLDLAKIVGGKDSSQKLIDAAQNFRELGEQLKLQEDEREGLLEAAGFGVAIGVGVHELSKLATGIVAEVQQLRGLVVMGSKADQIIELIQSRAEALLSEVKRLAPLRVTRTEAERSVSIRTAIEAARNAFVNTLEEDQIALHVDREDFKLQGRFGAIAQVFANLFDNAIYWIGTQGRGGTIQVSISAKNRTVLVADSGPGVSEKMKQHIFEPFYSEKSPPSGLGLYICRHYLSQSEATIRLARSTEGSKLHGAQFLLDFSKSPSGARS
jgi:signal transduction histidine kinase